MDSSSEPNPSPLLEKTAQYFNLAEDLHAGKLLEEALPAACKTLPPLTRTNFETLVREIDLASLAQPKLAWGIAAVADAAAANTPDRFLRSLAAWHLARAANEWVRPARVQAAAQRARLGFETLGEKGWAAACDWQRYALPWTCNDFNHAAAVLAGALESMQVAGLEDYLPHCRLSLAYAQILMTNHDAEAVDNIARAERAFAERGDRLNLARCRLHASSRLRRRSEYPKAVGQLEQALETFTRLNASLEVARTYFQLAYCQTELQNDYPAAEAHFEKAVHIFEAGDIPLWTAQCFNGLAQNYKVTGKLARARDLLQRARQIFASYEIYGLRADNLTDSGWIEMFSGNTATSIEYFTKAEKLYQRVGARQMAARAAMFRGRALTQFSRLQQAIWHLERAQEEFITLDNPTRRAEGEMFLAGAWIKLDHPDRAIQHLSEAAQYFKHSGHASFLITTYLYRAEACLHKGLWVEATDNLQEALNLSKKLEMHAQTALCHRLLGETLLAFGDPGEAWPHLKTAAEDFEMMGIHSEAAAARVLCGQYYALVAQERQARREWEQVLAAAEGSLPEVAWRAWDGLGSLAEKQDNRSAALDAYAHMVAALAAIRRDFWQPSLAGSYLRHAGPAFDRAVALAARLGLVETSLGFIEECKAGTLLARFSGVSPKRDEQAPSQLDTLASEIRWGQARLRGEAEPGLDRPAQDELIQKLDADIHTYVDLQARHERQRFEEAPAGTPGSGFDLAAFRASATQSLGHEWIAVEYYLDAAQLTAVAISHENALIWQRRITPSVNMALRLWSSVPPPPLGQHTALGKALFPPELAECLTPNTHLLLVPHRQRLHRLPWAALPCGAAAQPLAAVCIPVVAPSLQVLQLLFERSSVTRPDFHTGLLLAVSEFKDNRPALPHVVNERRALQAHLGPGSEVLAEHTATRKNLQALAGPGSLERFDFWHVATHAFHDGLTGRLSGLALHNDEELWVDHLWDLAPLPGLVTLSACSGTRSLVLEGDEHLGLATTCLAAGAQCVVGSLWPIPDDDAAVRMVLDFYAHLWDGCPPARALALAQRAALRRGDKLLNWGGFSCVGAPKT